ncbi:MFS transporter (plasmid) [Tistrella mobilis]|uniref:MFS transporter n=1 Tax=Tistrella mobilis TaxID=171437 RepID=UPI0035579DE7
MATTGCAASPQGSHWPAVGVVLGAGIVTAFHAGKVAIATPMLQRDPGIDLAAAGWLAGIFAILGCLGGIPAGSLAGRAGDRPSLIAGLALTALGAVIGATASGYGVLLVSRILEGGGFLLITVAGPAILNRIARPGQQDIVLALWSCFMPAGLALAMFTGPLPGDWRLLWWGGAGLGAALILAVRAVIPPAPTRARPSWRPMLSDALQVVGSTKTRLAASCFALYSLMFFALFSFLPVLLMTRMGLSHSTAGWLSALAMIMNIIGNLTAGWLLMRGIRRAALLSGACLIMGLSSLGIFLPVFDDIPTVLLCLLFAGVGGLIPAALISAGPTLTPSAPLMPLGIGLLMQGSNLGQLAGPVAVGSAVEAWGWPAAAGVVAGSALIAILIARRIGVDDSQPARPAMPSDPGVRPRRSPPTPRSPRTRS